MSAASEIGVRLKACRSRAGLTVKQLGDQAGISWRTVYYVESGHGLVRIDTLIAISGVLDFDIHWLLTGEVWEPRQ